MSRYAVKGKDGSLLAWTSQSAKTAGVFNLNAMSFVKQPKYPILFEDKEIARIFSNKIIGAIGTVELYKNKPYTRIKGKKMTLNLPKRRKNPASKYQVVTLGKGKFNVISNHTTLTAARKKAASTKSKYQVRIVRVMANGVRRFVKMQA